MAGEIKGHDVKYEETLREREKNNPKFAFILRKDVSNILLVFHRVNGYQHRRHAYYRGLIESSQVLDPEFDDEASRQSCRFYS